MDQRITDIVNNQKLEIEKLQNELKAYELRCDRLSGDLLTLEQDQARFTAAVESVNLGTWEFRPADGILTWSEECRRIYGAPPNMPVSFELFAEHVHPDDRDFVLKEIGMAMNSANGHYDVVFRILRISDKEVRWVKSQGRAYFNYQGRMDRFIGTVLDITDKKLSEEKSAYLASIIESSDDAIISKTLDGIITSWNLAAQRIFGYTADEIIGKPVLILIPDGRKDEEPRILNKLRNGERVDHFETKRVTKYGHIIDISLTISPIKNSDGRIIGVSKIARDITDKKREEQKRNDFISMVSHELKTPLTSIKSFIQILIKKTGETGDPFIQHALSRTDLQVKKMVNMVTDFLYLSRLEEAKIMIKKEAFDMRTLIAEVVSEAQVLFEYNNIRVNGCGVLVFADRDKIGQVLTNLISNAIKYSENNEAVYVNCIEEAGDVVISVKDAGIGISPEDQNRIFERFYRVNNSDNISGFGIGLYLSSELLKYHDSRIVVESAVGKGSTFSFKLKAVV